MAKIIEKKELAPKCYFFKLDAPRIAKKAKAGQFIVFKIGESGERIPLTIAKTDPEQGVVSIIFQEVGKSTIALGKLNEGDDITDLVGPLGHPTRMENYGTVVAIGGGIGVAPVYPIVSGLKKHHNNIITIMGARSRNYLILESEMKEVSRQLIVTTDDGSYGRHGFVTDELMRLLENSLQPDLVIAIGPVVMMQAVCAITKKFQIKTIVSLNPIMVDGTGMCGSCRVNIGGHTHFVCVDGPEFDGHLVDFEELKMRQRIYLDEEKQALEAYKQGQVKCGHC